MQSARQIHRRAVHHAFSEIIRIGEFSAAALHCRKGEKLQTQSREKIYSGLDVWGVGRGGSAYLGSGAGRAHRGYGDGNLCRAQRIERMRGLRAKHQNSRSCTCNRNQETKTKQKRIHSRLRRFESASPRMLQKILETTWLSNRIATRQF